MAMLEPPLLCQLELGLEEEPTPEVADSPAGRRSPTLDELLVGTWRNLNARHATDCPMCGAEMAPFYGAHALSIGGRCRGCGTELS